MATLVNYTCKSFLKLTPGFSRMLLRACLHGGGGPQVGEVTCLCEVKNNPPLHAILQPRHPGVHFLKIIEWSLTARKQEKSWQTTHFGD